MDEDASTVTESGTGRRLKLGVGIFVLSIFLLAADIPLVASQFVIGGDFWDQSRAMFVYSDKVCSSTA